MPKNTVSDPITDQEIAFARLILSGTMNDRHAAEAVGLNPESAAYTKAKHRVRAYMIEHRAAVREKLVDQEAEGLRKQNLGRDQILARLWELATLSHYTRRDHFRSRHKIYEFFGPVSLQGCHLARGIVLPDQLFRQQGYPPGERRRVNQGEDKVADFNPVWWR